MSHCPSVATLEPVRFKFTPKAEVEREADRAWKSDKQSSTALLMRESHSVVGE